MPSCSLRGLVLALAALVAAPPAAAGIIFYTDRTAWEAAIGAPLFSEDFSGFTQDTSFQTSAVALNGLTIQQVGSDNFRNEIDVGPDYDFTEHDGTNHASVYTNFDSGSEVHVRLVFDLPNAAFGFETWVANDQEGALLEVYDGAVLLGSQALSNDFGGFLGYELTGGDAASEALLRSASLISGQIGEGYGLDDLAGSPIPEPGTAALGALGLAVLGALRRRRSPPA